ncbi:CubicO group peptidase, beta-lactamase class C family [Chitinophaga eiseniae]|uniref:CubicO group peptidase, beta-lactamase class C family n=1 Tax=Chitinophaga eiseniae TaxID=634771 RepID=A0A1T4SRA2_9BACT|nr:serine hydrolase [Chitinophaga eiseniae]SKA30707.1 CubicO group peptidase, beta-lactamase class C family [Chitinophaga eiseniae]
MKIVSLFLLLITAVSGVTAAQSRQAALIDSMVHRAHRLGVFNGNVLIADHRKVVYKTAIGAADATGSVPLTVQHRFHIGSIAKEFNAVGIMMLKAQGKLSLDDKVSRYVPGLPSWADSITILHLLQYTSGLPDINWKTAKSDADILHDLKNLPQLMFRPGSNYAYNNANVFLQRRIIEQVTGMPFNTFVEKQQLQPCGMTASMIDPTEKDSLMAIAFNDDRKPDALFYPISGWTAVTLDDFYKWSESINSFRLLSPEDTRTILYPAGPNKQAGLGGGEMKGDHIIRHIHDGSSLHFNALLVSDPPKGRTVILMTNNKQGNLYELNTAIQAILDGKPWQQPRKSAEQLFKGKLDTLNAQQCLALFQQLKKQYAEQYDFDSEAPLNNIGYYYLGHNQTADAIVIFEYNTRLFPSSGNVFDSLGEAYYKKGDKQQALANYKRSLALDPGNTNAKMIIAELEK